jgi:hypothetical protein
MATITFNANGHSASSAYATAYDDDPAVINHVSGSGVGFFGGGFGISVPVAQYQDSSYVTNSNGTASGIKLNNTKYVSVSGLSHNGGGTAGTSGVPNYHAPLNIRFEHSEAVRVQNCKMRIFDRNDIAKHASGVTTQVLEVRHPHPVAVHNTGSGSLVYRGLDNYGWTSFDSPEDMADLAFTASPGMSGLNTSAAEVLPSANIVGGGADGYINWLTNEGSAHQSTRHDWYVSLSASPDSIGSKTDYGLYFTLEYL